jgi:hypothetical protein
MSNLLPPSLLFADGERCLATLDGLARTLWLGGLTNSQAALSRASPRWPNCAGNCSAAAAPIPTTGPGRRAKSPCRWPPPSSASTCPPTALARTS